LKVTPVIDLLNGVAVHAVRGIRSEYKPLLSILAESADPVEIAKSFKSLGFRDLYIADLDAIIDCTDDFSVIKCVADNSGLDLMVDAGITAIERAERLFKQGVTRIVVGTETLQNTQFVSNAINRFGSDRIVLSLDLKAGKALTKSGFNGSTEPIRLLQEFKALGVSSVIVLDLDRVGSEEGVDTDFLKKIIKEVDLEVVVGGGVRDIKDLLELKTLGISGALVATALHTGKIRIDDLKRNDFF